MKWLILTLLLFISIPSISCSFTFNEQNTKMQVLKVLDGDTIVLKNENNKAETIRFYGIDTPETLKKNVNENELAKYENIHANIAKNYVIMRLKDNSNMIYLKRITSDQYNRTVAILYLNNKNPSLNEELIAQGFARVAFIQSHSPNKMFYTKTQEMYNFHKTLIQQQESAKIKQLGIWKFKLSDIYHKLDQN
ncbi:thermonuclease family protein [Mycoplasmopsis edwardii]|nr:thermonuclease family protein [Mycoplasmopsis edwardii]